MDTQWMKLPNIYLPIRSNMWSFSSGTILIRTGVTSLSHQVHAPLWQRSVSHGHSECHLDHMPAVHGCHFTRGPCHLPPWARGDYVDDVMWCPHLKPRKQYPTGSS